MKYELGDTPITIDGNSPDDYQQVLSPQKDQQNTSSFHRCNPRKHQRRILDRDGPFEQSMGRWNIIRHKGTSHDSTYRDTFWLYICDPFHSIIHMSTPIVWTFLTIAYMIVILIYAGLYLAVDDECQMEINNFVQGMYFSVETMITIGYGAQGDDVFFNDCAAPLILIITQSFVGILLDSLAIGIVFQRFSRGQSRANTIIFSQKACVRKIRGHLYMMFQVCEMRKHQLTEAHVRCYAIRSDTTAEGDMVHFQSYPMRLQHPDDDLGGMILMALPSVVVHRIDAWSPLLPHSLTPPPCVGLHDASRDYKFPEPLQRAVDADSGNREASKEASEKEPAVNCHVGCPEHGGSNKEKHAAQLEYLQQFWDDTELEVIVLVEGVDAASSYSIQARHSYTASDIFTDHTFDNCVTKNVDGAAVIDFTRFHEIRPVGSTCTNVRGSFY